MTCDSPSGKPLAPVEIRFSLDDDPEALTLQLVEGLSKLNGTKVAEIPPVGRHIPLDALHTLFEAPIATGEAEMTVSFTYNNTHIKISNTGTITFTPTN